MDGWKLVRAADFVDFNPRESVAKGAMAKKVAMEKLQPFTRDIPAYEVAPFNGGAKFRNGDIIMARITPCLENGKTALVNILDEGEVGFGSTEFIVLRAKPVISDKDFVYYLAMSPILRDKAIKSMVGSSGRQRVQQGVLNDTEFMAPPLSEQIEIGRTLRALDDKIENNTKINHHLTSSKSATDNSPDIRRGISASRSVESCEVSIWADNCFSTTGFKTCENRCRVLSSGNTHSIAFTRSRGKSVCPVLPEAIAANSLSRCKHH
jgi:hypothetical protein